MFPRPSRQSEWNLSGRGCARRRCAARRKRDVVGDADQRSAVTGQRDDGAVSQDGVDGRLEAVVLIALDDTSRPDSDHPPGMHSRLALLVVLAAFACVGIVSGCAEEETSSPAAEETTSEEETISHGEAAEGVRRAGGHRGWHAPRPRRDRPWHVQVDGGRYVLLGTARRLQRRA
jgi:hypothetical protein